MATEPTLEDTLQEILDVRLSDVHTALPGKVVRYDATRQVADVQPQVQQAAEAPDGSVVGRRYPVLVSVPVAFLAGGGFFLSFPIAEGDTGLLLFNELPIDRWRATGQESAPADVRRHHATSAIFLPGLRPSAAKFAETDQANDLVLGKTDGAVLHLKPNGEVHAGAATASSFVALATLVAAELTALKTAISGAAVVTGDGGAAFKTNLLAALASWPGNVAATKVKAL